jgi:predicted component of type VI protein secretion system
MSARLTPLIAGIGSTISLQRPVLLIGRHPECDVRIDLPKISRRHCCVALAYDRIVVRDLGSRNGLRVNGQLVEEAVLQVGDEIAIGPMIFRLEDPEAARAAASPPPSARGAAPAPVPPAAEPVPAAKPPSLPSLPLQDDELVPLDF